MLDVRRLSDADYYTRHDVLNDEEIKILKDIAEPRQEQAGIGGPNKEKTWRNKITDKLKRNSTVFWFRAGENAEADEVVIKVVNALWIFHTIFMGIKSIMSSQFSTLATECSTTMDGIWTLDSK